MFCNLLFVFLLCSDLRRNCRLSLKIVNGSCTCLEFETGHSLHSIANLLENIFLIIIGKKTFGLIAINGFLCIHVSEIYLIRSFVFVEGSLRLSVSFGAELYYFYEILIIVHY